MNILKKILRMKNGYFLPFNNFAMINKQKGDSFTPPTDGELLILSDISVEGNYIGVTFEERCADEYLQLASITVEGTYASA